jgi:hypothetical protein
MSVSHEVGDGKTSSRKLRNAFTLGLARRLSGHIAVMADRGLGWPYATGLWTVEQVAG